MNDFNGDMRKGGRGGGSFRSHSSKEPVMVGPLISVGCRNIYEYSVNKHINVNTVRLWISCQGETSENFTLSPQ